MAEVKEGQIELGTFEVRAVNEGGAEVRLADEKHGSSLVLRQKSLGKGMERGRSYVLAATLIEVEEAAPVVAEVPADKVDELPREAKILEGGKKVK